MLNLSVEELGLMSAQITLRVIGNNTALEAKRLSIKQLGMQAKELEKAVEKDEKKLEAIRTALILEKGIPEPIARLREKIIKKMERAGRKNITVSMKEALDKDIPRLKTGLQKMCAHPFVYDRPGYEGTPSNDHENGYPGLRYCMVCGFSEDSYGSEKTPFGLFKREYLFKILIHAKDRIITQEPFRPFPECKKVINIWQPLGTVLRDLEKSIADTLNS